MNISDFIKELKKNISPNFSAKEWKNPDFSDPFFSMTREGYYNLEEEVSFLKSQMKKGPYLDLGGGGFRLSNPLSKDFFGFTLDSSFHNLKNSSLPCINADIKNLPVFNIKFELILLAFGQICFLSKTELKTLLKKLKSLLKPKGKIYLDLPTIEASQDFHEYNEWMKRKNNIHFFSREFDLESSVLSQRQLVLNQNGELINKFEFSYQMYSIYELLEIFNSFKLKVEYGAEDFNSSSIKETSPWMIFLISKK